MTKTLWRETLGLWVFSFIKIPLVFWLKPRIMEISSTRCVVMMRFKRRTRNHVNSMYFGAICVGAELAAGVLTIKLFRESLGSYTFLFKDFQANFLKRFEGDAYFTFDEGRLISEAIQKAQQTNERQNLQLNVVARVPDKCGDEIVATFKLTLSLKNVVKCGVKQL